MRVSKNALNRFIAVDDLTPEFLRQLLDSIGIEVKRISVDSGDAFYDLELLANRGDHRCYAGLAREIHACSGRPLRDNHPKPELSAKQQGPNVRVETPLCMEYHLAEFELPQSSGTLSAELQYLLVSSGNHSVNAPVDAANLVELELGQPLHVFDADRISGAIVVRRPRPGETCHPLFGDEAVVVPDEAIVIADESGVLAIAGVIGCKVASVTANTRRLYVESACFDPVAVRKTSRAMRISTSASQRFERGSDPQACIAALARFNELLKSSLGIDGALSLVSIESERASEQIHTTLNVERMKSILGWDLDEHEVELALLRLGYGVERLSEWRLTVPSWRIWDVTEAADVYEDVLRCLSYEACPESSPRVDYGALPSGRESDLQALREALVSCGFYEVFTDAYYGNSTRRALLPSTEHPLWPHVEIVNAIDRHYSLLKNNCIAQAVEAVHNNARFGEHTLRLFEICKTFHLSSVGSSREREVLWCVATGDTDPGSWRAEHRDFDFWDAKGVLRTLSMQLKRSLRVVVDNACEGEASEFLHPFRRAALQLGEAKVGVVGEIAAEVLARFDVGSVRIIYFELDLGAVLCAPAIALRPQTPPARPPSRRAISFVVPSGVMAAEVSEAIKALSPEWLVEVRVADSFNLADSSPGARSLTFELLLDNLKSDRTAKEINALLEMLIVQVPERMSNFGVRFRQ